MLAASVTDIVPTMQEALERWGEVEMPLRAGAAELRSGNLADTIDFAEIDVIAGHETAFEAGVAGAAPHFKAAHGCRSFALTRSIEHPQRYRLTVGWDSVEDHIVHFRESAAFQTWRGLVGPHVAGSPRAAHVERVIDGF